MKMIKNKLLFIFPILAFVIVIITFYKNTDDDMDSQLSRVDEDDSLSDESNDFTNKSDDMAMIDVKGEVKNPGIYEISGDKRVDDVLELAGGFTGDANALSVNRAEKVYDEMVIIVPGEGDEETITDSSTSSSNKVRINHATQEEIESLSGIGPAKAQAILQYREENGPFKTIEDLLEISGIGEKTLENFEDNILVP